MSDISEEKEKTELFPLRNVAEETVQKGKSVAFTSFKPLAKATRSTLEDLLSSDDDAEEAIHTTQDSTEKKRRRHSVTSEADPTQTKRQRSEEARTHYFDKTGDKDNKLYEGIYRLDVPIYRRAHNAVHHGGKNERKQDLSYRYFASKYLSVERSRKLKRLKLDRSTRLQTDKKKEPDNELCIPVRELSIENDDDDTNEQNVVRESLEDSIKRKTKELNIRLREHPYELKPWLELASFQDDIATLIRRRVSVTSTAEKKLSILSNALKFHPKNEELLCNVLRLYAIISTAVQSQERYQAVLAQLPYSLPLWRSYWKHVQSSFADFSCEKMRGILEGGLKGIEAGIRNRSDVVVHPKKSEEALVAALIANVQFDLQSGYNEKAIAKIQATLEWTFNCPENRACMSELYLHQLFQSFWETTAVAKIGEQGAQGFAAYVANQIMETSNLVPFQPISTPTAAEPVTADTGWSGWFELDAQKLDDSDEVELEESDDDEINAEEAENEETEADLLKELGMKLEELESVTSISPEAFAKFLRTEEERSNACFLPTKPDTSLETDVDRLVLFEELQPFLIHLQQDYSKKRLMLGILMMLGVDVSDLICSNDAFYLEIRSQADTLPFQSSRKMDSVMSCGMSQIPVWYQTTKERGEFVVTVLEYFSTTLFQSDIRLRKIWLETAIDVEERFNSKDKSSCCIAVGQRLLEERKDDLNLWTAYGAVLHRYNLHRKAKRVWKALASKLTQTDLSDTRICPQSIVCEIVEGGEPDIANILLFAFISTMDTSYLDNYVRTPKNTPQHSNALLTKETEQGCTAYFRAKLNDALLRDQAWDVHECVLCIVHLDALIKWRDSEEPDACQFYLYTSQEMKSILYKFSDPSSRNCEALHEKYVEYLTKTNCSPREVKQALNQCLSLYPSSLALLDMMHLTYTQAHTAAALLEGVKSLVFADPRVDGIVLVLMLEAAGSLQRVSLPSLFERVLKLNNGAFASVPIIWRLYLQISAAQGGSDFKRVFLRSIRGCPWSKAVWMQGLQSHNGQLKNTELMDMVETMKEKGVMLRTDVFEILLSEMHDVV